MLLILQEVDEKFNAFESTLESEMVLNDFKTDGKSVNLNYLNIEDLSELDAITKIITEAKKNLMSNWTYRIKRNLSKD